MLIKHFQLISVTRSYRSRSRDVCLPRADVRFCCCLESMPVTIFFGRTCLGAVWIGVLVRNEGRTSRTFVLKVSNDLLFVVRVTRTKCSDELSNRIHVTVFRICQHTYLVVKPHLWVLSHDFSHVLLLRSHAKSVLLLGPGLCVSW